MGDSKHNYCSRLDAFTALVRLRTSVLNSSMIALAQIDIATGKVVDQLAGIDALGVGIFNTPTEKQLYYGDARSSNLMSVPLTEAGNFNQLVKPNYELSLLALKSGDSTQLRKIVFNTTRENQHFMALSDAESSFRMAAETARKYKIYNFQLSKEDNSWQLLSVVPQ